MDPETAEAFGAVRLARAGGGYSIYLSKMEAAVVAANIGGEHYVRMRWDGRTLYIEPFKVPMPLPPDQEFRNLLEELPLEEGV